MDKAIVDALTFEEKIKTNANTKGRFKIQARTNAGNWI
jgi:hypothetical protein